MGNNRLKSLLLLLVIPFLIAGCSLFSKKDEFNDAVAAGLEHFQADEFIEAEQDFETALATGHDNHVAEQLILHNLLFQAALQEYEDGYFEEAISSLNFIVEWKDSADIMKESARQLTTEIKNEIEKQKLAEKVESEGQEEAEQEQEEKIRAEAETQIKEEEEKKAAELAAAAAAKKAEAEAAAVKKAAAANTDTGQEQVKFEDIAGYYLRFTDGDFADMIVGISDKLMIVGWYASSFEMYEVQSYSLNGNILTIDYKYIPYQPTDEVDIYGSFDITYRKNGENGEIILDFASEGVFTHVPFHELQNYGYTLDDIINNY